MKRIEPIEFARSLRQTSDEYERLLWSFLRNRQRCGHKFRRQHPLEIYTADFYCAAAKLVVEIDGESHTSEEAKLKDSSRDGWMRSKGIRVLRFTCGQVERDTQTVLLRIDEALVNSPSPPAPLPANSDHG